MSPLRHLIRQLRAAASRMAAGTALLIACDGSGPSNVPPTAAFTAECHLLECTLTNRSTDPDGTVDAYEWEFGDGQTSSEASPAHVYTAAGTYVVTLSATDDLGETGSQARSVTVHSGSQGGWGPVTFDFTVACSGLHCTFTNGTAAEGYNWIWEFGDQSANVTTDHAAHTYAAPGRFTVTLTGTDLGDFTSSTTRQLDVKANGAPVAGFSFSCADLTCGFTDRSFDNDAGGSVSSRQWDFGDGETSTEANPTHSFLVAASYTVRLTVIDNMGEAGTVSRQVTVPPQARTTPAFSVACSSLTCTFTDETTTGDVLNIWQWDFGDGSRSSEQNPVHTYAVTGPTQFTVTLTVWDSNIGGGTVSRIINVAP